MVRPDTSVSIPDRLKWKEAGSFRLYSASHEAFHAVTILVIPRTLHYLGIGRPGPDGLTMGAGVVPSTVMTRPEAFGRQREAPRTAAAAPSPQVRLQTVV